MFDIINLIRTTGYLGVTGVIFAESGFIFGSFFPGDSLLFTAGVFAGQGLLHFPLLVALIFTAAVSGNSIGYLMGYFVGPRLFKRDDSFFFHKDYIERTKNFYGDHGPKTIVLARFIPIVRTFAPIMAGVGKMPYRTFITYNILGGALWSIGLTGLGYVLGNTVENIDRYLLPIVIAIIIVSLIPAVREFLKHRKHAVSSTTR